MTLFIPIVYMVCSISAFHGRLERAGLLFSSRQSIGLACYQLFKTAESSTLTKMAIQPAGKDTSGVHAQPPCLSATVTCRCLLYFFLVVRAYLLFALSRACHSVRDWAEYYPKMLVGYLLGICWGSFTFYYKGLCFWQRVDKGPPAILYEAATTVDN